MLGKVQKLIAEGKTDSNLVELLDKTEVTESDYIDALKLSSNGNVVREPDECFINSFRTIVTASATFVVLAHGRLSYTLRQ